MMCRRTSTMAGELLTYLAVALLVAVVLGAALGLRAADVRVPLYYNHSGDMYFHMGLFKTVIDTGWYTASLRLGAPGTMELYDFPYVETSTFLIARLLATLTRDVFVLSNMFYALSFLLAAWASLFALRELGISTAPAAAASLLFAFAPYHFFRGLEHPHLSLYFPIPLVVLLGLWIGSGEPLFVGRLRHGRARSVRRTVLAVWIGLVASLAGPYYVLFALVLVAAAGLIAAVRRPHSVGWLDALLLIGLIGGSFAVQAAPFWIHTARHGRNPTATARSSGDYSTYGLGINNLLVPSVGHRVPAFRRLSLAHEYESGKDMRRAFFFENESIGSSPLGLIGSAGFVMLLTLGVAAPRWVSRHRPVLTDLAALTLALLLFGLTGGFSEIVSLHITDKFRSFNRVSIILMFTSLAAVAIVADWLREIGTGRWSRRGLFPATVACVAVLALLDQVPTAAVPDYATERRLFESDRAFFGRLEKSLPTGAAVFVLPVSGFPESPDLMVPDYDHMRGYLHTERLRWSYGAMKGRPTLRWQMNVAAKPAPAFSQELRRRGFAGILLNRNAYRDQGVSALRQLSESLGAPALQSNDGELVFLRLR